MVLQKAPVVDKVPQIALAVGKALQIAPAVGKGRQTVQGTVLEVAGSLFREDFRDKDLKMK